jgi:hypothetical protein
LWEQSAGRLQSGRTGLLSATGPSGPGIAMGRVARVADRGRVDQGSNGSDGVENGPRPSTARNV